MIKFSVFLLIIFVAELAVGIAGYMKHQDLEKSIMDHLNATIKEYPTNKDVKNMYDILQTDMQCCGIEGASDWTANGMPIPDTCCAGTEITGAVVAACTEGSPHFHGVGCLSKLVVYFKDIGLVLGGVGLGVALVQLLGVIFACCLARSIRNQYETV